MIDMDNQNVISSDNRGSFKFDKKMLIIGGAVIGIIILIVILTLLFRGHESKLTTEDSFDKVVEIGDLLYDLDDKVNNKEVRLHDSNEKIYPAYNVSSGIKEADVGVKIGNSFAKVLVVRNNSMKADIYKGIYEIKEYEEGVEGSLPPLVQIGEYMENFRREARFGMGHDGELVSENLTGESKYNFPLPVEESIYTENRMYTSTYEAENLFDMIDHENDTENNKVRYDLNFYMQDKYFVCEFVRFY